MLNEAPIILNCFKKGGSNILWNVFQTHPDICSPITETQEIFSLGNLSLRQGLQNATFDGYLVALLSMQPKLFNLSNLSRRKGVSKFVQKYIDKTIYKWKLKTLYHKDMKYKNENEVYTLEEVKNARLVLKNNNGLVFLSDLFAEMYPNATFFALIRHPLALYESYKRRKIVKSIEEFVDLYQKIAEKMIQDNKRLDNYHIVKFEDLLEDPLRIIKKCYKMANLAFDMIEKIRFKAKTHFQKNGRYDAGQYIPDSHYWFDLDRIYDILEPNINKYQMNRLENQEKEKLIELSKGLPYI